MHLLEPVASPEQQERYLRPLAAGEVRSCFAMTEPAPGRRLRPGHAARPRPGRDGGGWVIYGRKWFITGADGAAFAICMARTGRRIGHDAGATMFLVDADNPGLRSCGASPRSTAASSAGTARSFSRTAGSPADAVLGEVGDGFRYAQVRLAPARLTHCMRWLGLARRALDIALDQRGRARGVRPAAGRASAWSRRCGRLARSTSRPAAADDPARAWMLDTGGARPRVVDRQDLRGRGGRPRRRPLAPDLRRLGVSDDLPLAATHARCALPHLRRPERGPPLGHRAARPRAAASATRERAGRRRRHTRAGRGAAAGAARSHPAARGLAGRAWSRPGPAGRDADRLGPPHATFLLERGEERRRCAHRPPLPPRLMIRPREARV